MVNQRAPYEIALSASGSLLSQGIILLKLAGQDYLKLELDSDESQIESLGNLAMTRADFLYYDNLGGVVGPLLKSIDIASNQFFPKSLVATCRYRGKTNELFTQFIAM